MKQKLTLAQRLRKLAKTIEADPEWFTGVDDDNIILLLREAAEAEEYAAEMVAERDLGT